MIRLRAHPRLLFRLCFLWADCAWGCTRACFCNVPHILLIVHDWSHLFFCCVSRERRNISIIASSLSLVPSILLSGPQYQTQSQSEFRCVFLSLHSHYIGGNFSVKLLCRVRSQLLAISPSTGRSTADSGPRATNVLQNSP